MCGRDEATASYWLFGLLLTEGGTGEEQAAIVLRNDSGEEACLPSSEVSAQALIPVNAAPGRFGYVSVKVKVKVLGAEPISCSSKVSHIGCKSICQQQGHRLEPFGLCRTLLMINANLF